MRPVFILAVLAVLATAAFAVDTEAILKKAEQNIKDRLMSKVVAGARSSRMARKKVTKL